MQRKRIVVMGFMAGCPIAGVVWQHIHYIVGLQRLGHDVYYIEDSARYPYNPVTYEQTEDYRYAAETLDKLAREFGFEGRWSYCARFLSSCETAGLQLSKVRELYREADAILNVCGAQEFNEDLLQSQRILYVESDPGVEQIKIDKGESATLDYLKRHHALFTFGESIGTEHFSVPLHNVRWLPTRQPVVTDLWKADTLPPASALFTSVANWNTSGRKDIEWQGDTYLWSKSLEFLKFIEAPKRAGETFELATNIKDPATIDRFTQYNWRLADPDPVSIDHNRYRAYLQGSKGEFTAAKDQYVRLNTGWFSDRSACYLAAGRPVITQETGFTQHYGGNGGLFAYRTLEEIAEAVRAVNADYTKHSRAAYEVAAEFFEATKVLEQLLEKAS
ncbi:glycosyltransferase [Verrucomicrobiota bacterium sgz303538]